MNANTDYTLEEALGATVIPVDGKALTALRTAELEHAGEIARRHERSYQRFMDKLTGLCTLNKSVAESCNFSLPRGRKFIEGPSVRFAELAAPAWGNLEVSTTIMEVGDRSVVIRGRAHDHESNYTYEADIRRVVQWKRGASKADEDSKQLAVSSGTSIARRNVILAIIPRALWWSAYEAALDVADGKDMSMQQRRVAAIGAYAKLGATEEQVLARFGRETIDELAAQDIRALRGMLNAIKENQITLTDALRPPESEKRGPAQTGESKLGAKLKAESKPKAKPAAPKSDEVPDYDPETGEVIEDIPLDAEAPATE